MSNTGSILYVDDEESNLTVFEAAFEDLYQVHLAKSGPEALELLEEASVQVLVTDMRMPGMGGVELLERVIVRWPDIIRIILTGYTDIESIVRAINQGHIYQYVTKPWDERDVKHMLDRALSRYRAGERERRLRAELDALAHKEELIRSVFQRYVPPEVVQRVFDENPAYRAGAARSSEVVLLFADLRGFTELCGKLDAPALLQLMNEYFTVMTDIIDARGGEVTAYLGDAIAAVFRPSTAADEDIRAVTAAVEMGAALAAFNQGRAMSIVPAGLHFGVGIHRGRVTMGEVGAADARAYAVVGDAFYQVKEVEARTKGTPDAIVVTGDVAERLRDAFELLPHGEMVLDDSRVVALHRVGSAGAAR
jgi:adenylate cyclase